MQCSDEALCRSSRRRGQAARAVCFGRAPAPGLFCIEGDPAFAAEPCVQGKSDKCMVREMLWQIRHTARLENRSNLTRVSYLMGSGAEHVARWSMQMRS